MVDDTTAVGTREPQGETAEPKPQTAAEQEAAQVAYEGTETGTVRGVDPANVESETAYYSSDFAKAKVENNFRYHAPQGDQAKRYERIRNEFKKLAYFLLTQCPESREFALAMTSLEEANMWANASIARNET
jgi:hypothetical protein